MALFDNGFRGNILTGLAIGIGASVIAPAVIPVLANVAKPLAKAAIKSGLLFYEKGRETFAETREILEDLVAEAKSEISAETAGAASETEDAVQSVAPEG
ncbi:MAG: DUF5132 domain-containing protein [Nitrospirota bacterium]